MSTLRLLAEQLGISVSTASRALNGYQDVSASTRARVQAAADALGYRPHPLAHRLATGRTGAVALVSSMRGGLVLDSTFESLLTGIDEVLSAQGLYTLATPIPSDEPREIAAFDRLLDGRLVDAVIVARTRFDDPRVDRLIERGLPFITYGRTARADAHAWVDTDNEEAFRLAVERLAGLGHRRVDFINGPAQYTFARLREQGWRRALEAFGLQGRLRHVELSCAAGDAAAAALLAERADTSALLCANDALALGAMSACKRAGRRVGGPGGVAVVGYGNTEAGRFADPPLTTIDYSIQDNGRHLGRMLIELLGGTAPATLHRLEPVRLIPRASDVNTTAQGDFA
jgi:LacI family transcriptional regulator